MWAQGSDDRRYCRQSKEDENFHSFLAGANRPNGQSFSALLLTLAWKDAFRCPKNRQYLILRNPGGVKALNNNLFQALGLSRCSRK